MVKAEPEVQFCNLCHNAVEDAARYCPYCGQLLTRPLGPGGEINLEKWGKVVVGPALGQGGMGIVYQGWLYYDPEGELAGTPPHPVAVKVMSALLQGSAEAQRAFAREADALRRLSHPNIVHFFALDSQGPLSLIMELVQGEPLSAILERASEQGRTAPIPCLPLLPAWHYFSQLLGALAAIHALGIVHRDVKPANVLVRTDGIVKLSDFGIARLPTEHARSSGALIPGTGAYMSPEQVMGEELDARADLYSAGIVLFEMLTGVTPFDSPTRDELDVRRAQLEEPLPSLQRWLPDAPPVLDELLQRALAKHPAARFSSALTLGEAFRTAFGLPETRGWQAQKRLAEAARTLSNAMHGIGQVAAIEAEVAAYRTEVMREFAQ